MRVLHDALRPPDGHDLEHLLVTTFTLDLVSLLSVPLAFAWFGGSGDDEAVDHDPLELLAAVERQSGKITVFHQAGAIGVPDRHRQLLTLVEDALVAVPVPRRGGLFHPKLWIAAYVDGAGKRRYRLLCLSRNLTADRSWDTILCLEGVPTRSARRECKPLVDFVTWLARMPRLSKNRAAQVRRLGRELSSVKFEPPLPFSQVQFRPLGVRGYRLDPVASARRDNLLIVSPFVGAGQLAALCAGVEDVTLVTRPEELARLDGSLPANVGRSLRLDDALEPEPDDSIDTTAWLAGLHAKAYIADQGWNATLWTGSANATGAAFQRNVEFLVELTGKKSACGIQSVLGDGSAGTFSSMLVPCDAVFSEPEDDALEQQLDALAREIAELPLEVRSVENDAGWSLQLALGGSATIRSGARVDLAPLASTRGPQRLDLASAALPCFLGLKAQEVSGLFVVDVQLDAHPEASRHFVAAWPLVGTIPDRVHALILELASDPERMFAFIRMFLAGGESSVPLGTVGDGEGGAGEWGAAAGAPPLLELLVRALAREPQRLDELARWLPDLAAAAGDGPGTDLLRIWEPIWKAREELAR